MRNIPQTYNKSALTKTNIGLMVYITHTNVLKNNQEKIIYYFVTLFDWQRV